MTSSVHDLSDKSGPSEQQIQVQPDIQHQNSPNGNFQHGMAAPSAEHIITLNHLEVGHTMAQLTYPYTDPYFGGMIAAYAGQPAIHPNMMGLPQPGMPLPTGTVLEPVYVNAKQYHGILRRRQSRAKAESENKLLKCRKPYLHESRHLHALKRARGCGGRFLNSKADENQQQEDPSNDQAQKSNALSSESSCSEDIQNTDKTPESKCKTLISSG